MKNQLVKAPVVQPHGRARSWGHFSLWIYDLTRRKADPWVAGVELDHPPPGLHGYRSLELPL